MSGSESQETQLNREAICDEAYQVIMGLFEKHCPNELGQIDRAILTFGRGGSRRRERVGEPSPNGVIGMERVLQVEINDEFAKEMEMSPIFSISMLTVLERLPGISKAISYCFINMSAPYTPSENDPEVKHQVVIRRSNIANEPRQAFVIGEDDDLYIMDQFNINQFSDIASPADQDDLDWIKGLVDAIKDADDKGRIEAVGR